MKRLIVAAVAAVGLAGCVAVPAPYYPETAYYPGPAVSVGIGVSSPGYYGYRPRHRYYRGW